ncbi:MAG: hypothetical protein KAJ75_06600 [Alphaproteobacteria bacterium]|nr:hypothetical protein [Alphaproteobacteria bacterium]
MASYIYHAVYGAGGTGSMFQIVSIEEFLENKSINITNKFDQGVHLQDENDLKKYIAKITGNKIEDIDLEQV